MNLRVTTKYVCGIDLHARKMSICVMDRSGKIYLRKEIPNSLPELLTRIASWEKDITIGVESTFNWYWLIDGLTAHKVPAYLGHALYIKWSSGQKHKTDSIDARQIADLLRTDRFPLAYSYPPEMRAIRDLLRRRHFLVRCRAATYTHFKNTCTQQGYIDPMPGEVQRRSTRRKFPLKVTGNTDVQKNLTSDIRYIETLDPLIYDLESHITGNAKSHNHGDFKTLLSIPGCGPISALTVLYEMHTTDRFKSAQRFSSYCRVVRAANLSSDKDYGRTSRDKIGNPYLKWALSEIAVHIIHRSLPIKVWYDKQVAMHGLAGTHARLRHKLAVAIYQMLKNRTVFDEYKFIGKEKKQERENIHLDQWTETSERRQSEPRGKGRKSPAPVLKKRRGITRKCLC
jgi:transposase